MDLPRLAQLPLDVLAVEEVPEDELVLGQSAPRDDQRQRPLHLRRTELFPRSSIGLQRYFFLFQPCFYRFRCHWQSMASHNLQGADT